jgi:hypothetical protein
MIIYEYVSLNINANVRSDPRDGFSKQWYGHREANSQ